MNIDYISLKKDLLNFYGTSYTINKFLAIEMVSKIENASNYELIEIAKKSYFNLNNYTIHTKKL